MQGNPTGRGGPGSCEISRLPHSLDSRLADGGEVVNLKRLPLFSSRMVRGTVRGRIDPRAKVRSERIRSIEKSSEVGNLNTDLPA